MFLIGVHIIFDVTVCSHHTIRLKLIVYVSFALSMLDRDEAQRTLNLV